MGDDLFDKTISLLGNAAGYRVDRHGLLTSNLANIQTPGYKTKDISFEQRLQEAIPDKNQMQLVKTNAHHLPVYDATGKIRPQIVSGGEVDLDLQMTKLSENNLLFTALVQLLGGKYRLLRETIDQGGR